MQNVVRIFLRFRRKVSPEPCERMQMQLLLYNLHSSGISLWIRRGYAGVERFFFLTWEKLEDAQHLNNGCRFSQQPIIESREKITRNKTLSIDYKQRPFRLDESRRNRESRIETQQSRIECRFSTRFSQGSRIECQLTFERYCTLYNVA